MRLQVGDIQKNLTSGRERTITHVYGDMLTIRYNKSGYEYELPRVKTENDKRYILVSRRVVKNGVITMKYGKGDRLYDCVAEEECEVLQVRVIKDNYKVRYPDGEEVEHPRNIIEGNQFKLLVPVPFPSRENKEKTEEEPMKKSKSSKGYRFRVSSLHAVDIGRIERESLTKDNPVAILHSKGEFKVVIHDSLWQKGVWGVEDTLSELFEKSYHRVGGDFSPMDRDALEYFLELCRLVKYAPWKGKEDREIRVDIPKL